MIEIQKRIQLHNDIPMLNQCSWTFHAAICHRGESIKQGHYYALICKKMDRFYKFDHINGTLLDRS